MHPDQAILFTNTRVLDGSGAEPFDGDVLVEGSRIAAVGRPDVTRRPAGAYVVDGRGGTLMPGLCDAHTHCWILWPVVG